MQYIKFYESPLGKIIIAADEIGITGLWFDGQKYFGSCLNPISIMLPCHRVIGANGSLTGYAGGIDKKKILLTLEQQGVMSWK